MAGLGRQIGRLEIMIERCLKDTVGGEWGTKTRTLGMSFDNDSGLHVVAQFNCGGVFQYTAILRKEARTLHLPGGVYLSPRLIRPAEMKGAMRKVSEYEAHAAECRRLADQMSNPEHKTKLIQMAETWEMLAIARVKQLSRKKSKGDA